MQRLNSQNNDNILLMKFDFTAKIWKYTSENAWYFVTIPVKDAEVIREITTDIKRGFGSVRVTVTIANLSWDTSIFPDKKSKSYLLPIKKDVRERLALSENDKINLSISVKS